MYSWYEKAAEALVYLADVLSSAELDDLALTNSRWMTRAWALQERLASKGDWELYLNDTRQPEDLRVREKPRLASTHNATKEDIAYSLIGIFSSDIAPRYGLGKAALHRLTHGRCNRDRVDREITAILFCSSRLSLSSQAPHSPPPMEDEELDTCMEQLRTRLLVPEDATAFHYRVTRLPRATFSNRCLQLPCIMFYVTRIVVQELGGSQGTRYRASVSSVGKVEFSTVDVMPLERPRKLVFVYPWLRDLQDPVDGFMSDDEPESRSDSGSCDEPEANSDAGSGDVDDASAPASLLHAESLAWVDLCTSGLRLIARLGCPFNALLLEQQSNSRYKRVATEHEIIIPGIPSKTKPKDIKSKVAEIV